MQQHTSEWYWTPINSAHVIIMWLSCIWLLWLVAHQQWHSLHHASSSYRHSSMVSFREEKDCVLLFNNTVFYLTTEASNLFSHLRWRRRRWWALEHFFEKHPSTCERIENYNRLSWLTPFSSSSSLSLSSLFPPSLTSGHNWSWRCSCWLVDFSISSSWHINLNATLGAYYIVARWHPTLYRLVSVCTILEKRENKGGMGEEKDETYNNLTNDWLSAVLSTI